MKLFYDLRLDRIVAAPGQDAVVADLAGKAGDGATQVQIIFGRSSDPTSASSIVTAPTWTPENLPGGTVIKVGIKEDGAYSDGTLLASNATWTHDAGAYMYTGALDLNTVAIDTALSRDDADDSNDIESLACNFELTYQPSGAGGWRSSVEPVAFTLYHDILVGDEATPTNADDPDEYLLKASGIEWLPTVTSQIGGTAADLDGIATVDIAVGKAVMFKDADSSNLVRLYQLIAGTDAESAPTTIRPDDYNASTNAKVWRQYPLDVAVVAEPVNGLSSSVANEVVLFNGTDGKQLKRATTTGIAKLTSGVLSAATAGTDYASGGAIGSSGLTMSTARLLGRSTASTGAVEQITVGSGLTLSGGNLTSTAGVEALPSGVVTLTADTSLLVGDHDKKYIECGSGTSTVTISAQADTTWVDGSHFWIINRKPSGTVTLAEGSGVTLISVSNTTGSVTLSHADYPIHLWRSASNEWRVIS